MMKIMERIVIDFIEIMKIRDEILDFVRIGIEILEVLELVEKAQGKNIQIFFLVGQ